MPEIQKIEKIGVSVLCRVSTKGGAGTYLYIPRLFSDTYKINCGDAVEVYFRKVFKKTWVDEEEPKPQIVDLTKGTRGRPKKRGKTPKTDKSVPEETKEESILEEEEPLQEVSEERMDEGEL